MRVHDAVYMHFTHYSTRVYAFRPEGCRFKSRLYGEVKSSSYTSSIKKKVEMIACKRNFVRSSELREGVGLLSARRRRCNSRRDNGPLL